jgi:HEAT repeat protein
MRPLHRILGVLAIASSAALPAGCVTEEVARDPGPPGDAADSPKPADPAAAKPAVTDAERERDAEFGRVLQATDKRVDQYIWLGPQPGDEARRQRDLEQSALEAVVAQHADQFAAALADRTEPTRRRIAAKALAFSRDRRATPALVAALREKGDAQLQTNAAFALSRLRDPDTSLPALLDGAQSPDVDVRVNSLLALGHVLEARAEAGRPADAATRDEVLPVLETALFDPDDAVARGHAAAAMGALGDPRGVDPLLNLLRDKHTFVRTHVGLALGKLGDRRAIRPLVDVIDDTQQGSPRSAVILGVSLLLEREGITIPADMPDDERVWSGFVQRALPPRR